MAQLQATFASGWAEASGELITGDVFFPPQSFAEVGPVRAALLHSVPTVGSTPAERFLALSISGARRTLYISNSYFVPDDDFRDLLVRAAKRGVDVRVLTAGDKSDVKTTLYAGRARYPELIEGGVRIYEYQPTMMHAKTFVVDGVWSTVGSLNFDNRSLVFNNESNLVALDEASRRDARLAVHGRPPLREGDQARRIQPTVVAREGSRVGREHAAARALTKQSAFEATLAANVGAAERGPNCLAHGDDRVVARRRRVVTDVDLDPVGDDARAARRAVPGRPGPRRRRLARRVQARVTGRSGARAGRPSSRASRA